MARFFLYSVVKLVNKQFAQVSISSKLRGCWSAVAAADRAGAYHVFAWFPSSPRAGSGSTLAQGVHVPLVKVITRLQGGISNAYYLYSTIGPGQ